MKYGGLKGYWRLLPFSYTHTHMGNIRTFSLILILSFFVGQLQNSFKSLVCLKGYIVIFPSVYCIKGTVLRDGI